MLRVARYIPYFIHIFKHLFWETRIISTSYLTKERPTKSDDFLEKCQRGEGIFNPKIYIADFGKFKQVFLSMKLIQKSNFRVHGDLVP